MRKPRIKNSRRGFTLAELLIVIAIMGILAAIGFVAVIRYRTTLKLTEMDRTAEELYITAQGHLSESLENGGLQEYIDAHKTDDGAAAAGTIGTAIETLPSDCPESLKKSWATGSYRYIIYDPSNPSLLDSSILKYMLPAGSFDDTVRKDGHYVIEYSAASATVYGVFYTDHRGDGFVYSNLNGSGTDYRRDRTSRTAYPGTGKGGTFVIGYYGGSGVTLPDKIDLKNPYVQVVNGNRLYAIISNPNGMTSAMKLYVHGRTSGNTMALDITVFSNSNVTRNINPAYEITKPVSQTDSSSSYQYYACVLDDITHRGSHFSELYKDLIPGEDIDVYAVTFSQGGKTAVKTSNVFTTNSLYGSVSQKEDLLNPDSGTNVTTAEVGSIRHLENLDPKISNVSLKAVAGADSRQWTPVVQAQQSDDLYWENTAADTGAAKGYKPFKADGIPAEPKYEDISGDTTTGNVYDCCLNTDAENVMTGGSTSDSTDTPITSGSYWGIYNPLLAAYSGNWNTIHNLTVINDHLASKGSGSYNAGLFRLVGSSFDIRQLDISGITVTAKAGSINASSTQSVPSGNAAAIIAEIEKAGSTSASESKNAEIKVTVSGVTISGTSGVSVTDGKENDPLGCALLVGKAGDACSLYLTDISLLSDSVSGSIHNKVLVSGACGNTGLLVGNMDGKTFENHLKLSVIHDYMTGSIEKQAYTISGIGNVGSVAGNVCADSVSFSDTSLHRLTGISGTGNSGGLTGRLASSSSGKIAITGEILLPGLLSVKGKNAGGLFGAAEMSAPLTIAFGTDAVNSNAAFSLNAPLLQTTATESAGGVCGAVLDSDNSLTVTGTAALITGNHIISEIDAGGFFGRVSAPAVITSLHGILYDRKMNPTELAALKNGTVGSFILCNPSVEGSTSTAAADEGCCGGFIGNFTLKSSSAEASDFENILIYGRDNANRIKSQASGSISGGFIGRLDTNNSALIKINNCASTSIIEAANNGIAGGFIGLLNTSSADIENSYSGGHTNGGLYDLHTLNVTGGTTASSGVAGGFIGQKSIEGSIIKQCYSTCSVKGYISGGFIGSDTSNSFVYDGCYAAGYVCTPANTKNTISGMFAGKLTNSSYKTDITVSYCFYGICDTGVNAVGSLPEGLDLSSVLTTKNNPEQPSIPETHNFDSVLNGSLYIYSAYANVGKQNSDSSKVYYGDWVAPKIPYTADAGLAYRETIIDKDGSPISAGTNGSYRWYVVSPEITNIDNYTTTVSQIVSYNDLITTTDQTKNGIFAKNGTYGLLVKTKVNTPETPVKISDIIAENSSYPELNQEFSGLCNSSYNNNGNNLQKFAALFSQREYIRIGDQAFSYYVFNYTADKPVITCPCSINKEAKSNKYYYRFNCKFAASTEIVNNTGNGTNNQDDFVFGSSTNPYYIRTADQLNAVNDYLDNKPHYYCQTCDIMASATAVENQDACIVGSSSSNKDFLGVYTGQYRKNYFQTAGKNDPNHEKIASQFPVVAGASPDRYTVFLDQTLTSTDENRSFSAGLFYKNSGTIQYLHIGGNIKVTVSNKDNASNNEVDAGALAAYNYSTISNCSADASMDAYITSRDNTVSIQKTVNIGGLCGHNMTGTISDSTANSSIQIHSINNSDIVSSRTRIGVLLGNNQSNVQNCSSSGTIQVLNNVDSAMAVGGLIGYTISPGTLGSSCTSASSIIFGSEDNRISIKKLGSLSVGGLIGYTDHNLQGVNEKTGVYSHITFWCNSIDNNFHKNNNTAYELAVGGVIGYSPKNISNYSYNGKIVIDNSGEINNGYTVKVCIGGIAGHINDVAGCTQSDGSSLDCHFGKVNCNSVMVGGVAGNANGAVSSCIAEGTASVTISAFSEQSSSTCIGGTVGYAAKQVANCEKGSVLAANLNGIQKGTLYLGGVAGRTDGNASKDTMNGTIAISQAGDISTPAYFGGSLGYVGGTADGCTASCDIKIPTAGTSAQIDIGGVVAYAKGNISNLTNSSIHEVSLTASGQMQNSANIGGICGECTGKASNCTNVNMVSLRSDGSIVNSNNGSLHLAGVVGSISNSVSGCTNTGRVLLTANGTADQNQYVGGILGESTSKSSTEDSITGSANSGSLQINVAGTGSANQYIGGIAGKTVSTISSCNSTSSIAYTYSSDKQMTTSLGGIIGNIEGGNVSGSNWNGEIDFNPNPEAGASKMTCSGSTLIGGIAAETGASTSVKASKAEGSLLISSDAQNGTLLLGGIVAKNGKNAVLNNVAGNCNISAHINTISSGLTIGGLVAENISPDNTVTDPFISITGSTSRGQITINKNDSTPATVSDKNIIHVGGVVGSNNTKCNISKTSSVRNISCKLNASGAAAVYAGGFAGFNTANLTDCHVLSDPSTAKDKITAAINLDASSGWKNPESTIYLGGLAGYSKDNSYSLCSAESSITLTGNDNMLSKYIGVGGFAGYQEGNNTNIDKCFAASTINNNFSNDYSYYGGFVGKINCTGTAENSNFSNSYAAVDFNIYTDSNTTRTYKGKCGMFVGNISNGPAFANCFAVQATENATSEGKDISVNFNFDRDSNPYFVSNVFLCYSTEGSYMPVDNASGTVIITYGYNSENSTNKFTAKTREQFVLPSTNIGSVCFALNGETSSVWMTNTNTAAEPNYLYPELKDNREHDSKQYTPTFPTSSYKLCIMRITSPSSTSKSNVPINKTNP